MFTLEREETNVTTNKELKQFSNTLPGTLIPLSFSPNQSFHSSTSQRKLEKIGIPTYLRCRYPKIHKL